MEENQTLNFLRTVATYSPQGVNLLATRYGYHWPQNTAEGRLAFLATLWEDQGDKALYDMALIHPDRKLICSVHQKKKQKKERLQVFQAMDGNATVNTVTPSYNTSPSIAKGLSSREKLFVAFGIVLVLIYFITHHK